MAPKINIVDGSKIKTLPVENKTAKNDTNVKFNEMAIKYEYPNGEVDNLRIELPFIKSYGIKKMEREGRIDYSLLLVFPLSDPKVKSFVDNWNSVTYETIKTRVFENKAKLGIPTAKLETIDVHFKNQMYVPIDQLTGDIIEDRDPLMYVRLLNFDKLKSRFYGLDGKQINWDKLYDVEITHAPIIQLRQVFFGTQKVIRIQMDETIIKSIKTRKDAESSQKDLARRVLEEDPDALKVLSEQISSLVVTESKEVKHKEPEEVKEVDKEPESASYEDFIQSSKKVEKRKPVKIEKKKDDDDDDVTPPPRMIK